MYQVYGFFMDYLLATILISEARFFFTKMFDVSNFWRGAFFGALFFLEAFSANIFMGRRKILSELKPWSY